jgi:hypothetical protein
MENKGFPQEMINISGGYSLRKVQEAIAQNNPTDDSLQLEYTKVKLSQLV